MPAISALNVMLTPQAKEAMSFFLSQIKTIEPTIVLLKARIDNEAEERVAQLQVPEQ